MFRQTRHSYEKGLVFAAENQSPSSNFLELVQENMDKTALEVLFLPSSTAFSQQNAGGYESAGIYVLHPLPEPEVFPHSSCFGSSASGEQAHRTLEEKWVFLVSP